jgi:hypothetical protein
MPYPLVAGVEFSDSLRRQESCLALTVGAVNPEDIAIGGEIVGEQYGGRDENS